MRHTKILRIECKTCNIGPYSNVYRHDCDSAMSLWREVEAMQYRHTDYRHSPPYLEGYIYRLYKGSPFYCGFKTKTQARKWLSKKDRDVLHCAGFVIREFKVPVDEVMGTSKHLQIVFTYSKAHKVAEHSIKEFFNDK